jgi:hypothetical protein
MKYAVEMESVAIIYTYIPNLIETDPGIQNFIERGGFLDAQKV